MILQALSGTVFAKQGSGYSIHAQLGAGLEPEVSPCFENLQIGQSWYGGDKEGRQRKFLLQYILIGLFLYLCRQISKGC